MNYKVIALSLIIGATSFNGFAQDEKLTNKNGRDILPEAGEIGLGFNAIPVFTFIGNMFNGNTNNTSMGNNKFVSNFNDNAIFGKYMLEEKAAIRAHFRIGIDNNKISNFVVNDAMNHPDSLVTDMMKMNTQMYVIGAGYEMRRGKGRIQGIFGGEGFFMFGKSSSTFEYGNEFGMVNQAPTTTTNFFSGNASPQGMRTTYVQDGNTVGFGIRPFVGIEYYIAPKISLGAEFGWNLMFISTGEGTADMEYFEPASGNVLTRTTRDAGRNNFSLDTDNFNGAIYFMFYF